MDERMTSRPDAIDPRVILRVYAALATTTGVVLAGWGTIWFGGDLCGAPFGRDALVRTFGAMIAAMGCLTFGLAAASDPASQRRGVIWLIVAHVVVGLAIFTQWLAIWQPGPISSVALGIVTAAAASLFYLLVTMDGDVGRSSFSLTSIFGASDASPANALQSQYEQQIREAAKQEERNYLARDLHDSVKQQIFAIHTSAAAAQAHMGVDEPETRAALEQVRSSAREAMAEMEAMLDQLRATPLDGAGLVDVLTRQCEALQFRTGANVRFTHGLLPPDGALGPGAHQALFRVAQEALANVGRHARATEVNVSLNVDANGFTLEVQDNGAGFDPSAAQSGMGVTNMRARTDELGGTLIIRQRPGGGTTVRCSVPCTLLDRDDARRHMRNRGAIWLVILVSQGLFTWKTPGPLTLTVISTIGLIRSIVGYRAVSRRSKVGR